MSQVSRLTAIVTRIAQEIRGVRTVAEAALTEVPQATDLVVGGVKLDMSLSGSIDPAGPYYHYSTLSKKDPNDPNELVSVPAMALFGGAVTDHSVTLDEWVNQADPSMVAKKIRYSAHEDDVRKMLKAAIRWEQEILVQSGTRTTGYGMAPLGINVPYGVRIKGIRYQLETMTTGGTTQGNLMRNQSVNLGGQMNIAAGALTQDITGLDIAVPAGARLSLNTTSIGTGTIGKGLYMSLYGEYDLAGITL